MSLSWYEMDKRERALNRRQPPQPDEQQRKVEAEIVQALKRTTYEEMQVSKPKPVVQKKRAKKKAKYRLEKKHANAVKKFIGNANLVKGMDLDKDSDGDLRLVTFRGSMYKYTKNGCLQRWVHPNARRLGLYNGVIFDQKTHIIVSQFDGPPTEWQRKTSLKDNTYVELEDGTHVNVYLHEGKMRISTCRKINLENSFWSRPDWTFERMFKQCAGEDKLKDLEKQLLSEPDLCYEINIVHPYTQRLNALKVIPHLVHIKTRRRSTKPFTKMSHVLDHTIKGIPKQKTFGALTAEKLLKLNKPVCVVKGGIRVEAYYSSEYLRARKSIPQGGNVLSNYYSAKDKTLFMKYLPFESKAELEKILLTEEKDVEEMLAYVVMGDPQTKAAIGARMKIKSSDPVFSFVDVDLLRTYLDKPENGRKKYALTKGMKIMQDKNSRK